MLASAKPAAKNAADALIVGGGVIGLSAAYHLARAGSRVTLLEKGAVGSGASSRAGGIITAHLWSKTGIAARKISLRRFNELSEELGDYGYRFQAVGCLNLFSPAEWAARKQLLPLYDECDVPYEILDAAAMRRRWSLLKPPADALGLFDPLGGYSEPADYIPALTRRCRDLGVDIREGVTVSAFDIRGGRIRGVSADGEALSAERVICAAHSWTNRLLTAAGRSLPLKSFVHQRYVTAPLQNAPALPAVNANPYGAYFRPAKGKRILLGGETAARAEFGNPPLAFEMDQLRAPPGFGDSLREQVQPLLPLLAGLPISDERVGLISFSADGEPLLGALPGLPNLLLGAAFHSGGFAYNPVAGMLLAQLASSGATMLDISAFSPARFSAAETAGYLSAKLRQRDAFARRH